MIGVDDLRLTSTSERHFQSLKTELRVKALGELLAVAEGFSEGVHVPGEEIHDRHQVKDAFLQREVGDVGGPDLIHSLDRVDIHQPGKALGWISWNGGAGPGRSPVIPCGD
jgi:hypothetical protein